MSSRSQEAFMLSRLLERYQQSADEDAIEELVGMTRERLVAIARRIVGAADSEDIVQTAYMALASQGRPASEVAVMPWLVAMVVRRAYRARAQASRLPRLASQLAVPVDVENSPPANAVRAEEAALLREELDRLPDRYRDVLVLHHLQGLTTAEVAQLLGVPVGTVQARLQRGRALLSSRLHPVMRAILVSAPLALVDFAEAAAQSGIRVMTFGGFLKIKSAVLLLILACILAVIGIGLLFWPWKDEALSSAKSARPPVVASKESTIHSKIKDETGDLSERSSKGATIATTSSSQEQLAALEIKAEAGTESGQSNNSATVMTAISAQEQLAALEDKMLSELAQLLYLDAVAATEKFMMHGLAVGMFRQICEWDYDHKGARERLGYEQANGLWVRRADKTIEVQMRIDEFSDPETHAKAYTKIKKDAVAFCEDAAEVFTTLAKEAETFGLPADADRLWRQVLLFDIDNAEVRKKLGFVQLESGLWVPQRVFDQLTFSEAVKPHSDAEYAALFSEGGKGFEMKGAQTAHGTLLFPASADPAKVQALADVGERALLAFRELFLLGENFKFVSHHHYVVPTEEHYKYIVGRFIPDAVQRKIIEGHIACRSCTKHFTSGVTYLRSDGDVDQTAYIYAHQITESVTRANFGELPIWISETIANLIEETTTRSTNLSCVANRTDSDRPTVSKEGTEKRRRKAATDMIMEGLDHHLDEALAAFGGNEIEGSGIMKTTGIFNMLYMLDARAFVDFVRESVGQKGDACKEIFTDRFGRSVPEWDNWWKYLVLGTYMK